MSTRTRLVSCICLGWVTCLFSSCSREHLRTLQSPIQAVGTLMENADGTVEAQLVLITTEKPKHEFLIDAENVQIRVPSGQMVSLEQVEPGHYRTDSSQSPALVYEQGKTYQFRFGVPPSESRRNHREAEGAQEAEPTYVAVVKTPTNKMQFSWAKKPEFAGDTAQLQWTPRSLNAIVVVRDPEGRTCFSTFDFSDPQFGGDKWGRLGANGQLALGVDVFNRPGQYQVLKYAVSRTSGLSPGLSADLGVLSGFLAGTGTEIETLDIPE